MTDLNSGQILDLKITESTVNDCTIVKEAMEEFAVEGGKSAGKLETLVGDGAYDTYEIYKIGHDLGMKVLIPPARTSKAQNELSEKPKRLKEHLKQRDDAIDFIRKFDNFDAGLKEWKKQSGYHIRSKVEATMFRLKKSFGFYLQFKEANSRFNEMKVKINLLNRMLLCGRASYIT